MKKVWFYPSPRHRAVVDALCKIDARLMEWKRVSQSLTVTPSGIVMFTGTGLKARAESVARAMRRNGDIEAAKQFLAAVNGAREFAPPF